VNECGIIDLLVVHCWFNVPEELYANRNMQHSRFLPEGAVDYQVFASVLLNFLQHRFIITQHYFNLDHR